jgi:hypothetical protein
VHPASASGTIPDGLVDARQRTRAEKRCDRRSRIAGGVIVVKLSRRTEALDVALRGLCRCTMARLVVSSAKGLCRSHHNRVTEVLRRATVTVVPGPQYRQGFGNALT